jgi:ABC-type phosphate transport system, periplasmic component
MNFVKAIVAAGLVAASTSAFAADITGAGATFPFPIYSKWADAYKKETGNGLNYQSIGSGGGIKQIKAKTVTFGATDAPLKAEQLEKDGLVQWPMVMGAIVPVVNLEGIEPGELVLSGEVLGDIYLGKITKWDDPAIAKLNPKLKLPTDAIPWCAVPTAREPPSISPTTCRRRTRSGRPRSAPAPRSNGRRALAPRATKASPATSARPRTRSAMSNTPMPSRTS